MNKIIVLLSILPMLAGCSPSKARPKSVVRATTISGFSQAYDHHVVVDLSQVSATATVAVTGTCVKHGTGLPSYQYCDVSGWPYSTTVSSVAVSLNPTPMELRYIEGGSYYGSQLSLGRLSGTLADITLPSVPGIGPNVTLHSISFGSNTDLLWSMTAEQIVDGSSVSWSPVDSTLSTYYPNTDPTNALSSVEIAEVTADALTGDMGSMSGRNAHVSISSAQLIETGRATGLRRETYELVGTLNLTNLSMTYNAELAGVGITMAMSATITISFSLSGTAENPWPSPIYSTPPSSLTYPVMSQLDGTGAITTGTVLASFAGTSSGVPSAYDVYVDWGGSRGYTAAAWSTTTVGSSTVPAAVTASGLTITDWTQAENYNNYLTPWVSTPHMPYFLVT